MSKLTYYNKKVADYKAANTGVSHRDAQKAVSAAIKKMKASQPAAKPASKKAKMRPTNATDIQIARRLIAVGKGSEALKNLIDDLDCNQKAANFDTLLSNELKKLNA